MREAEFEACACSFSRIAFAACAFHHVIADLELSPALNVLICQPTITNECSLHLQLHCPQAETKFVIVAEIPFDPRPHLFAMHHFGVEPSGIGVSEHLEKFCLVRGSVRP